MNPLPTILFVGKPKLIEPNRYAVLFHKNRRACTAASGTQLSFGVRCPQCSTLPLQTFDRTELAALLENGSMRFYCIQCDNHWNATGDDAREITQLLARS